MADGERHSEIVDASLRPIMRQAEIENTMLSRARDGVLAALEWQTEGDTFTRKLSSVRFAVRTFQQHLERVFLLEEFDGYMGAVIEVCPNVKSQVDTLQQEHETFRRALGEIVATLERLTPTDHVGLQTVRQQLLDLLRHYDDHLHRETHLMQEAFLTDVGSGD